MSDDIVKYTPAQEDALEKSQALLSEHFESYVIVVGNEVDELSENGKTQEQADLFYGGGWLRCWGLILFAHSKAVKNFGK